MMFIFILLVVGFIIYAISTNRYNSTPSTYKQTPIYKSLANIDKLKMDLTIALEELVKQSLKISKQNGHSSKETNIHLISEINKFRFGLESDTFNISVNYRLPIATTKDVINSVCDGAIGVYVFNL